MFVATDANYSFNVFEYFAVICNSCIVLQGESSKATYILAQSFGIAVEKQIHSTGVCWMCILMKMF